MDIEKFDLKTSPEKLGLITLYDALNSSAFNKTILDLLGRLIAKIELKDEQSVLEEILKIYKIRLDETFHEFYQKGFLDAE